VSDKHRLVATHPVMGTMASLHLIGDPGNRAVFDAAAQQCWDDLDEVERVFSPFREDSDVRRLATGKITLSDADPRVRDMAALCETARNDTGGLFDAWWEGWFNPTGYVKGWAVEEAANKYLLPILDLAGVEAVGLSVGGDMWLRTSPHSDWLWGVGIADPLHARQLVADLQVSNGAVATSGTAERGFHILDPRTGQPARTVVSASVVAADLTTADLWATTAVVAGFDDLSWIAKAKTRSGLLIAPDGRTRRWQGPVEILVDTPAGPQPGLPDAR